MPTASHGFNTINGFTDLNGDVLDLRVALGATNWNGSASTLVNYLKVTASGGNTNISIAPSGAGPGIAIATLNGAGNLSLANLVSHNSLLT